MIRLIYPILILLILNIPYARASEHHGFWVVRHTLLDDNESANLVPLAMELGATDLYIQVRALGQFFFVEDAEFRSATDSKALRNFRKIKRQATSQNIRVHAWLNALYIGAYSNNGLSSRHLYFTEKKYILRQATDNTYPTQSDLKKSGIEGYYIDPLNTTNLSFIKQEIAYLVDTLKVDGIHLDYMRYPSMQFSFTPAARTTFLLKKYTDPIDLYTGSNMPQISNFSKLDNIYRGFLENNLSGMLQDIKNVVEKQDKKVWLSVAVKPDILSAVKVYSQNWPDWLKKEYCDYVILMNYNSDDSIFYKNINTAAKLDVGEKIVIGVASYNQTDEAIADRLRQVKKSEFAGYALFSYNDFYKKRKLIREIYDIF